MREVVLTVLSGDAVLFADVPAVLVDVARGRTRGFRGVLSVPGPAPAAGTRAVLRTGDGRTAPAEVAGSRPGAGGATRVAVRGGGWRSPAY